MRRNHPRQIARDGFHEQRLRAAKETREAKGVFVHVTLRGIEQATDRTVGVAKLGCMMVMASAVPARSSIVDLRITRSIYARIMRRAVRGFDAFHMTIRITANARA